MGNPSVALRLILDTSVVLKWFRENDEADVAEARRLRDAFLLGRCKLGAPDLLLMEVANSLTAGHQATPHEVSETITSILRLAFNCLNFNFPRS